MGEEEEFYSWLESLDPIEREEALYTFGFAGANEMPGTFAQTGSQPGLDYGNFDLSMFNQLPPELDKKGNVMPWGLDQQQQAYNTMQDLGAMTVDNALAMYGGPGAYGAGAFEGRDVPIGQPLDFKGGRYVDMLAQSGTGYESYLAQKIQGGMSPGAAIADMWRFIQTPGDEEVDPEQASAKQALIASLPPGVAQLNALGQPQPGAGKRGDYTTPEGLAASFDVQGVQKLASDLFERKASDPVANYVDPQTGLPYAGSKREESPITERYRAAGIPTPDESYLDEQWLNAPLSEESQIGRAQREAQGQAGYGRAIENVNTAQADADEMAKAWDEVVNNPLQGRRGDLSMRVPRAGQQPSGGPGFQLPENPGMAQRTGGQKFGLMGPLDAYMNPALDADFGARPMVDDTQQAPPSMGGGLPGMTGLPGASRNQPNFVTGANNELLGTYNFSGTPEEEAGVAGLADLLSQFGGTGRTRTRRLGPQAVAGAQARVGDTRAARQKALDQQIRLHEQTSNDEASRASAIGRAIALQRGGRTPTNDILMQRALARQALMGR